MCLEVERGVGSGEGIMVDGEEVRAMMVEGLRQEEERRGTTVVEDGQLEEVGQTLGYKGSPVQER